jgi:hypothetical protein
VDRAVTVLQHSLPGIADRVGLFVPGEGVGVREFEKAVKDIDLPALVEKLLRETDGEAGDIIEAVMVMLREAAVVEIYSEADRVTALHACLIQIKEILDELLLIERD